MKRKLLILFLIFTIPLLFSNISAQGTLTGEITDSLTNDALGGANVFIPGTSLGNAANIEGKYKITLIPEGNYRIKVSYIGYKSKELYVEIQKNKTTQMNVTLSPDILEGETVVISAQASGQAAAINQQRTSNTIVNVISEEKIKELPDANAAEAIGRLPGVSILRSGGEANKVILRGLEAKFTNITIDGIKIPPTEETTRGVDLSMISQNSLAGIELFKALTPDKDGDALAGSINLVTKPAPDKRYIRTDMKGSYNDLMNSASQYDFSLQYGERFFRDFLGVQLTGNIEKKIRSNERINVNYANQNRIDYNIDDFLLEFTDEGRKRGGLSLLLDVNTPDDGTIRINNVYGRTNRNYLWSSRDYASTPTGGRSNDGRPTYNYRDREQEINTFNSTIRGNNNLIGLTLNWGLSFAQSESSFPYDYELIFTEPNGTSSTPVLTEGPEKLIPYAVNNFSNAALQWAYYRGQDNFDKEKTAFLDVAKKYIIGNMFSGEMKAGGKYKIKDRLNGRNENYTPYYLNYWQKYKRMPDGSVQLKNFTGTYFEEWFNNGGGNISVNRFLSDETNRNVYDLYSLTPLISKDKLRQWWDLNKNGVDITGNKDEIWDNPLIKYDDYNITERVAAGYIMNTLNIGQQLTLITGLRVENEDNSYLSQYMTGIAQGFPPEALLKDTTSAARQTVWLPNVNISIRPYDFMNIRLAAYKALSRPDFNMRLDRYLGGRPAQASSSAEVFVGNPNLKTARAWNFEVNTSFYGNEIGLISLSAYYKEIKDMYFMLNNFTTIGDTLMQRFGINWPNGFQPGVSYSLTLPYNSSDPTKIWGFEFEHQINFHFLPGLLKGIVLSYNASIVRSEAIYYGSRTITWLTHQDVSR